jgi:hypothetical protein
MEKQPKRGGQRFICHRLLKAFFFVLVFAPSFLIAQNTQNSSLVFAPHAPACLVSENIVYSLEISGTQPSEVTIGTPASKELSLLSLQKTGGVIGGKPATIIRIAFNAREAGIVSPQPLQVSFGGNLHNVPFAPVTVLENSATTAPGMTLTFQNGKDGVLQPIYAETAVFLQAEIHNAAEIESFEWVLNENSMLREISRNGHFILLEWFPFEAGELILPSFTVRVKDLAGVTRTVSLGGIVREVFPALETQPKNSAQKNELPQSEEAQSFLQNAFATP